MKNKFIIYISCSDLLIYLLFKPGVVYMYLLILNFVDSQFNNKKSFAQNTDIIYVRQHCIPMYTKCVQRHHTGAVPTSLQCPALLSINRNIAKNSRNLKKLCFFSSFHDGNQPEKRSPSY